MKPNDQAPASSVQRQAPRVLIVDDEKNIRLTLRAFLQAAGYEVEVAEDVDQARALLSDGVSDTLNRTLPVTLRVAMRAGCFRDPSRLLRTAPFRPAPVRF